MRIGSICSGYGGLDMAVAEYYNATTAWFCEVDPAPAMILAHHWPDVPNHGDITTIDWAAVEPVDIITGGTPCQDISTAGRRAGMTEGTRSIRLPASRPMVVARFKCQAANHKSNGAIA